MPGLVPGIHALNKPKDVDGRDKPGHDEVESRRKAPFVNDVWRTGVAAADCAGVPA